MANQPELKHIYVQVNNSLVHLAKYGPSGSFLESTISTPNSSTSRNTTSISGFPGLDPSIKVVILFIPGNPGVLDLYHDFLCKVYSLLAKNDIQPAIVAIGHNNFDHPDYVSYKADERISIDRADLNFMERSISDSFREEPHHIELQVLNKLIITKRLLDLDEAGCKIIFVGHSIGCYVILRLLQDQLISSAHLSSILIHPALENLALTEKGSSLMRIFNLHLDVLAPPLAMCLDRLLPYSLKLVLAKWFCPVDFIKESSDIAVESVFQLVCPRTLNALILMAKSELKHVKDINTEYMIKPHVDKLKIIYAKEDHWVNKQNRVQLKRLFPDLKFEELDNQHAFVMSPKTVSDYAHKVLGFVRELSM